ncbi:MAG: amidohydrolase family protein [Eubacteriales bacterium]
MKIIDAHLHFSDIEKFKHTAKNISKVDYSSNGLYQVFKKNNIVEGIVMGVTESKDNSFPDPNSPNPMLADLEKDLPKKVKYCLGINPYDLKKEGIKNSLSNIEKELGNPNAVGFKIYPGYYSIPISDEIYTPIYEIAEEYGVPIVIHTGDMFANSANAEFSHPLHVNRLALKFKKVNFVIAHFGNPWVMDTAVVISNCTNVYTDLSGFFVGDEKKVKELSNNRIYVDNIRRALIFEDNYKRIMFGSDWPLVPMNPYIEFVKQLIPEKYYEDVFYNNAKKIFKI